MRKEWARPIQTILRQRQHRVRISSVWRAIASEYAVGVVDRSHLDLSDGDLDRLLAALAAFLNNPSPLLIDLTADRITLASQTPQEKVSPARALNLVRVAATDGYVPVTELATGQTHQVRMLPGTVLSVTLSQLALTPDNYRHIVIIENGAVIERWWDIVPLLPHELRTGTLFVYRGHGNEQRRLLQRLAQLEGETPQVHFFGDFDPSGIYIALTSIARRLPGKSIHILAPATPAALATTMAKPDVFVRQERYLSALENRINLALPVKALIQQLRTRELAITQETLIAKKVSLESYGG